MGVTDMPKKLVSDELWSLVEPLLPEHKPTPKGGRPRISDRAALTGIIFVLKTAIPWDGIVKKTAHPESTSSDQRAMCLNPLFTLNQRREIVVVGCVTPEAIIVSFNPTEDELPYLLTWHRNAM